MGRQRSAAVLEIAGGNTRPAGNSTRLQGGRLHLARLAWAVATALALGLFIAALPYEFVDQSAAMARSAAAARQVGLSAEFLATFYLGLEITLAAGFSAVALIVFWRRSDDWVAILVAIFLLSYGTAGQPAIASFAAARPEWRFAFDLLFSLNYATQILFFLFPDGRFVPRWTRWVALCWVGWGVLRPFWPAINPLYWPTGAVLALEIPWFCLGIYSQMYRYQRVATPAQQQQTKWVVFGVTVPVLTFIVHSLIRYVFFPALGEPGMPRVIYLLTLAPGLEILPRLLIPITIGIALLRYRLWDIDPIVNRTLVYGTLSALILALYVVLVGTLGALFGVSIFAGNELPISIIATGVVAVLFQPLRERLQRAVNRLMYGDRDNPSAVIARLGQRLEATLAPTAVLPAVVETVAQALKLPYVAIALPAGEEQHDDGAHTSRHAGLELAAAYGTPLDDLLRLPLVYQNKTVGYLLLAARSPGESFSPPDRRLLDQLAPEVGIAVHAVRLTAELQRSRERLVNLREDERRRMRRDLHDGLGPALASLTLKLEAARNIMPHDPTSGDRLLAEVKAQTLAAVADIRRLVYDLRPPALDDLGLLPALREQAAAYGQNGLRITIEGPDVLPVLPAAAEVAAYRIVQEGLTNVVRHAGASHCTVRLATGDELIIEITDDGVGLPASPRAGIGLTSMHERATELGGSCAVEAREGGGTRIVAHLPLQRAVETLS